MACVQAPAPESEAFPGEVLISPDVCRGGSGSPECECEKLAKEEVNDVITNSRFLNHEKEAGGPVAPLPGALIPSAGS